MKSVKKRKSVASALSVIDFEHLWSSRSDEHVKSDCVGTVFQTALFLLVVVPRLRPGIINMTRMAVWKTVPYKLFRLRLTRHVSKFITDNADATDLFFHGFFLFYYYLSAPAGRYDCHGLSLAGGYPAPHRRKYNP